MNYPRDDNAPRFSQLPLCQCEPTCHFRFYQKRVSPFEVLIEQQFIDGNGKPLWAPMPGFNPQLCTPARAVSMFDLPGLEKLFPL